MRTIHTTIGDLICAIADAATEAEIKDEDLSRLTHEVLMRLLSDRAAA